ncbi:MerR family transcriptional regulator [Lacrimispora sp. 38-1]|uniref:MerR family transcriptional regulator n=1 Tax=Lacrimispora sp. 38-1 TaxID=3125778 RepID=UPI003CE9091C
MTNLYTIGEVARFLKISTKALRNYDDMGLLKPSYISPETKYRYYSYEQFFIIDVIRYLNKTLGIPLENVKKMLEENKEPEQLLVQLKSHKQQLESRMTALESSRQLTEHLIEKIEDQKKYPGKIGIYEKYQMSRNLYYHKLDISIYDIDKYVTRNGADEDLPETNTMCLLFSRSDLQAGEALKVRGFGVLSEKKLPEMELKTIREGRYITRSFLYSEENTVTAFSELAKYAQVKGIVLDETAYLISPMVKFPACSKYEYLMELQIMIHL